MPAERTCPRCGTALAADALEGLCPTCVGRAAFGETAGEAGGPALSPGIEAELARLKPEEAGEWIGPYKLMEQIGQGGFGTVWVADQERPVRRRVALKIIKLGMDTKEVIARFEQERQALAMMDHSHIAKVLDAGATQWGRPYFVMELVRGIKITEYCDQANLPTAERLALFIQVCNAVQHAHQKGIIHRDLKPSNILVTLHDGVPVPKVIDFGVAKATQQQRLSDLTIYTQFQQMIGTPLYMSPEQAEMSGMDIDTRSDIYSLGVLLYELLTGRTPFDPEELMKQGLDEIRRTIREQEPKKPSTVLSTMAVDLRTVVARHRQVEGAKLIGLIRGDLDWIVMKALEKDRNRRYETATDFARDIQRFMEDQPVSAAAPSASYRLGKFVRRNKAALGVAALIFAILLAATGVSVWQANVAIAAKKDALAKATAERTAREESDAIAQFLTGVFESADPARDGRTITVAETLDHANRKLNADLASQPARRASLQRTLAITYRSLGLPGKAIPLQEEVLEYYRSTYGPNDRSTLAAMTNLGNSYDEAGHRQKAFKLRVETLALCRKVFGPDRPQTLRAMTNLANSYDHTGRREEALQLRKEALALHRKMNGLENRDTLLAMANLANSHEACGHRDEALKLREDVLPLSRKVLGKEHPDTLQAMINLAVSFQDAARRNEALKLQEEALPICLKVLGPEHSDTLLLIGHLAFVYRDAGRKDEALKMQEQVLATRQKVSGAEHTETLGAMTNLAIFYDGAGRLHDAINLQEQALTIKRRVLPQNHPYLAVAFDNMARLYEKAGRNVEALQLREDIMELRRTVNGPEHLKTLEAMTGLSISYHDAGRRDEALKLREDVVTLRRKVSGPEHPDTIKAMGGLANSYMAAGRLEEALSLLAKQFALSSNDTFLVQKITSLQVWFGKNGDHAATCRRALELAATTNDPSVADRAAKAYCLLPSSDAKLLAAALTLARRAVDLGKTHQYLPYYQMVLGMAEYRSGSYLAADEALTAAVERVGKDNRHVRDTARFFHAMSLFQQGKAADALKLFAKAEAEMKPLPADARQPFADGAGPDDLIVWLAYKEAETLLRSSR